MMIQIDVPGERLDFARIRDMLSHTGVELDEQYGVIPIPTTPGRHLVRGSGDDVVKAALDHTGGVQTFADPTIRTYKSKPTFGV